LKPISAQPVRVVDKVSRLFRLRKKKSCALHHQLKMVRFLQHQENHGAPEVSA
jgi:hypothetical protein